MEFDYNFLWGAILGMVLMAVIMFLWRNKKGAKTIFKKPPMPAFKKSPKIKKVDDTPPDTDWPGATVKGEEKSEDSLEALIKRVVKEELSKTKDEISPEEKARLEALDESNPMG